MLTETRFLDRNWLGLQHRSQGVLGEFIQLNVVYKMAYRFGRLR